MPYFWQSGRESAGCAEEIEGGDPSRRQAQCGIYEMNGDMGVVYILLLYIIRVYTT